MAELHVQRKQNSNWWLWLLVAIIIIAAAVFIYVNYYGKDANLVKETVTDTTSMHSPTYDLAPVHNQKESTGRIALRR